MKHLIVIILIVIISTKALGQNVGIGTNNPNASAILELKATDKGLLPPRLSSIERIAIIKPATGLMVYDTDFNSLFLFNGIRWVSIDQTNTINNSTRPNTAYTFSAPQFLSVYSTVSYRTGYSRQSVSISENLIVQHFSSDTFSPGSTSITWTINKNGLGYQISHDVKNQRWTGNRSIVQCFVADSLERNIYAVVNSELFRLNIADPKDVVKITDSLGNVSQIKVLANYQIILATDLNNGSIIKVIANGVKQEIASNLRFPNYFDIFNNNYYVTGLNALTGSVKRISQAGIVTTILSDIIVPNSIVFEKNGNFILQTNLTIGTNIYMQYNLYSASGQLIGPVNDASDNPILTIGVLNAPLFVDNFNNLVFIHNGSYGNGNVTSVNPVGLYGVWILKMNKL